MKRFSLWTMLILVLVFVAPVVAQDEGDDVVTTREALPDANQFTLEFWVGGFNHPLYMTHAGDGSGRLFVVEQSGRIWIVQDDALLNTPFINLSDIVSQDVLSGYSERGLLGLAFHPNYAENGFFFVNYTDRGGDSHIVRYTVSEDDPDVADPDSALELMTLDQPYQNHNGGQLAFGPDGYLYIAFGDGGSRDDPLDAGQERSVLLGKILRIDVNSVEPYGIPRDNPGASDESFAPEVWAWGLRNPWRFSFDRATGDLYIADVGQNEWEEINFQSADAEGGLNYGWSAYEGNEPYIRSQAESDVVMPIAVYDHSLGCSVTGGYVYRGATIPELEAAYLYSDYCSGRIWAAYRDANGDWQSQQIMGSGFQVSSLGEDEAGELYVVNYGGSLWKFLPAD